jgi:predicted O-linked N-acetylglucosamine transferase (SPINDLY family)
MALFARKPAPVQVTWIGYPNTTGLRAIDYRFTDRIADPPGTTEHFHAETLVRLPECFLCYAPPAEAPDLAAPPALETRAVTFGSFNTVAKVTDGMIALWARLLAELPQSRLVLKSLGFRSRSVRDALSQRFAVHGISAQRLQILEPVGSFAGHLARYAEIDIALDTFPYNGATTTCEALWMGVPVVSLAGATHRSRVGASLLHCVGLAELVAATAEDYVAKAVQLATHSARLRALRSELRQRVSRSPLVDGERYTRSVEAAYRGMWQRWCAARALPRSGASPL